MALAKSCPDVGRSNIQAVWVELEDVTGELQKPTPAGYIVPRGNASMSQTPGTSPSEELAETLNVTDVFQNAVDAGEISIPMYLRLDPDGGRMQGHALWAAALGEVQEPDTVTVPLAADIGLDDEMIMVGRPAGGFLPPSGVIRIEDEKIRYTGRVMDETVVVALTGCRRGYGGTTAVEHFEGTDITLASRVYHQATCRPTVSVWMRFDHAVLFGSGGAVTATEIGLSREGGQNLDFSVSFRRMGWAGRSFAASAPVGQTVKVETKSGKDAPRGYHVGGYVLNHTQGLDNNGAGYRITAVDTEAGTITLDGDISTWAAGDRIDAWTPQSAAIGEIIESRRASVMVEGQVGRLREGSISYSTPVEFLEEIHDEYPGESVDTKREISITMSGYFRPESIQDLGHGYDGYEVEALAIFGREPGKILSVGMPRVKMTMPEIGVDGAKFTLDRTATVLGRHYEDAFYVVQE